MNDNNMGWSGAINGTLLASGTLDSEPFNLATYKPEGFFSDQIEVTGDGTLKVEYLISNKGRATADFVKPTGASDIVTAHTKTSGPGSDGIDLYQWPGSGEPVFGKWMIKRYTETGGANSVTFTDYPNIQ